MNNRAYYQDMLLTLLKPLEGHYSKGGAQLQLGAFAAGYGTKTAKMEGFSRVLWGLASYWAGGGEDQTLLPVYQKGLVSGTDPASPEYWGDLHDRDQRMVEMAAISYGILLLPHKLWEPLSQEQRKRLADWLYQINGHTQPDNNWNFFKVMANLALKRVGMPWSQEEVQAAMERYEAFYLGNGWYSDGRRPQKDYYVSFGIHFYCLLYAHFMGEEDPQTAAKYRKRAAEFAKTFVYWFDERGRGLPFGRSLTYRFAQIAFFSACALAGVECLPWGVIRGMIRRHLDYWMRQPIFDNGGVLTVGYAYPSLMMSEAYNSPGSPYWALKAFVFLAVPDGHPFWQAEEAAMPPLKAFLSVPECDMLFCRNRGQVTALTGGQYPTVNHPGAAEKYGKFAYSTEWGFCVSRSAHCLEQAGTDSMLAFSVHGMIYVRRACLEHRIMEDQVYARWSPVEGIEVETWLIPEKKGHRRRHVITSSLPETVSCKAWDCGFSYPDCVEETVGETREGYACVRDQNGYGSVSALAAAWKEEEAAAGTEVTAEGTVILASPNLNLVFPLVRIPAISVPIRPGVTELETRVETEFTSREIEIGGGNCYGIRV